MKLLRTHKTILKKKFTLVKYIWNHVFWIMFLSLLLPFSTSAQQFEGLWALTYEVRPVTYIPLNFDFPESDSLNQGATSVDSSKVKEPSKKYNDYNQRFAIIHISESQQRILRESEQEPGVSSLNFERIGNQIKIEEENLTGELLDSVLVFTEQVGDSLISQTYWNRITSSKPYTLEDLDSSFFENSYWKIETDTNSLYHGRCCFFPDSNLIIQTIRLKDFGLTIWGEWNLKRSNGNLYFRIMDWFSLYESTFHFLERKGDTIYAESYEFYPFMDHPPKLTNLKLIQKSLPTRNELTRMKENLWGEWLAHSNPIPFDSMDIYDSLVNPKFEITFRKNGKFDLLKSGRLYRNQKPEDKVVCQSGSWNLSLSGDYIFLNFNNQYSRYLTIYNINKTQADISLEVYDIGYGHTTSVSRISLIKKDVQKPKNSNE